MTSIDSVREEFRAKGIILISNEYINTKQKLEFICPKCGGRGFITLPAFRYAKPENILCFNCSPHSAPTLSFIEEEFQKRGAKLLSKEYKNNKTPLEFSCSSCGKVAQLSWSHFLNGVNKNLLCPSCIKKLSPHNNVTFDMVKKAFDEKGVELISKEYVNNSSPLYFKCKLCGKPYHISWGNFKKGSNPNFLCSECRPNRAPSIQHIKELFASKGAELLSTEYLNNRTKLEFRCSICGEIYSISWSDFLNGYNNDLLCERCMRGKMVRPNSNFGGVTLSSRSMADHYWFKLIFEFFNIKEDSDKYSAHHIYTYKNNPDFRTSIPNGYPLVREEHYGNFSFYHKGDGSASILNWPNRARLPYHTYDNFQFLDLNSKIITEILPSDRDIPVGECYHKKLEYAKAQILYIPLYFEELISPNRRKIVFSMLRNRLYQYFPDIYKYTDTPLRKFYARKLKLQEFSYSETKAFFDNSHIQGSIPANIYLALSTDDGEIVSAMSLGKPRAGSYDYEILRFASAPNTAVVGGASKLFSFFINNYSPNSVVSFCDIRFSSANPAETVYPSLGFTYEGTTKPNYRYYDPVLNRLFTRQQFQKHKLADKLQSFDPNFSETENMRNNGYFKQYDCGNFKFVWTKN